MNNACISHLRISDADQIQIIVSRVGSSSSAKNGGTDITIQAVSKEKKSSRSRKLPPLQLRTEQCDPGLLSPSRIPSPSPPRSLSRPRSRSRIPSPQPFSPSNLVPPPSPGSRYHQTCFSSRPTSPVGLAPLTTSASFQSLRRGTQIPSLIGARARVSSPNLAEYAAKSGKESSKSSSCDSGQDAKGTDDIVDQKIEQYLLNNPDFVDAHVRKYWERYGFTQRAFLERQKTLNEFLLSMVRSIFQDMVSMDTLIKKILNFVQKLVDADRASLFLIDHKSGELYARLFDMGGNASGTDLEAEGNGSTTKEIRFKIGTGIAGIVAETGETLNIVDAYNDSRFNRHVDQVTGYVTKSILCMPIFIRGQVIGVVQMVNKRSGRDSFDEDDVEAFETMAVYCGLALHHAKLYDKIRKSEQKFKVALEVLAYHNSCNNDEFETMRSQLPANVPPEQIVDYKYITMYVDDEKKVHYAIHMFVDLFGLSRFDLDSLLRFIVTVKKNYRRVPYHNWAHGFTVAHSMYCTLKKTKCFKPLECLALYVGSLCHDLDHRGRNNQFMLDTSSPLASMYTTSTLEHHHFNQTISILQQDGLNIFSKLSSEEYKQVLGNIKHCILATDLALYFKYKSQLASLLDAKKFDWKIIEHRCLAQAIAMTAADLCASAKPWDVQVETVKVIFEEFWEQGDIEKQQGRTPIPMMDRDKSDQLPKSQVGFLTAICISCYELLHKIIPETKPLLEGCQSNLVQWKEVADSKDRYSITNSQKDGAG